MMSYTLRRYTIGTNCDSSINSFLNINHLSGSNRCRGHKTQDATRPISVSRVRNTSIAMIV